MNYPYIPGLRKVLKAQKDAEREEAAEAKAQATGYLPVARAAKKLGIPRQTLSKMAKDGEIPGVKTRRMGGKFAYKVPLVWVYSQFIRSDE